MEILSNNFIISGLNFDKHSTLKEEGGQVYYVRNGDISDFNNSEQSTFVQNATSNQLCVEFPNGLEYSGHIELDKKEFILFLGRGELSSIYLFREELCTLELIIAHPCLDFQEIITGTYKYHRGERIITFLGKSIRRLNLSHVPLLKVSECSECDKSHFNQLDCEALKVFSNVKIPNVEIDVIEGNIPDGVYQIAFSPINTELKEEGSYDSGDWFIYKDVFNLHSRFGRNERFGLRLTFDCITSFKVALIAHREDRGTVAQEVGTFNSKQVIITELDTAQYFPISNEQLLLTSTIYQKAEHIATNSEHLVLGNLTERADFNYQSQANNISSEVNVLKVKGKNAYKYSSFMSDEVYKFSIQWVYKDGQTTNWTHIPSNLDTKPLWFTNVSNNDTWTLPCNDSTKKYWEVYNTAELTQVLEENDNGSIEVFETPDPLCKEYKLTTASRYWYVTVTYSDCDGNPQSVTDLAKNIRFCTLDVNSVNVTFKAFTKEDLLQNTDNGNCILPNGTCNKFSLVGYNALEGTNCGEITYNGCDNIGTIPLPVESCNISKTYSGDLTNFTFCTCETLTNMVITVLPCAFTIDEVGVCGFNPNSTTRVGSECEFTVVAKSTFAYWESSLKYPNEVGFEALGTPCNTGIKYHKFPDRTATLSGKKFPHIHSTTGTSNSEEYVYILAPSFGNIEYPKDCNGNYIDGIVGYRIGVASRANNKSIIHKGLINNMREETLSDCTKSYFANYPFNDLREDPFLGSQELLQARPIDSRKYLGKWSPMKAYAKDKFQYISPDIQYQQNDNNFTELLTYREENGYISAELAPTEEVNKVVILSDIAYRVLNTLVQLGVVGSFLPGIDAPFTVFEAAVQIPETFHKLLAGKNYAYNFTNKSNYTRSNTNNIIQGNRRRAVKGSTYLQPIRQSVDGFKVNNYERESGLFLTLDKDITNPSVQDNSRFRYTDIDTLNYEDSIQQDRRTSSYYVGLKKNLPNQYGSINDSIYRNASNIVKILPGEVSKTDPLISGDIYITKHSSIKKFPFFTNLSLNAPFDTPYITSEYLNVGYPRYWLDVVDRNELVNVIKNGGIGKIVQLLTNSSDKDFYLEYTGTPSKKNCNSAVKNKWTAFLVNGLFYTHIIGILEYYCESEYIGDYREVSEVPQSNYYPIRDIKSFKKYDTILYPEVFLYNQQQRFLGVPSKYRNADYTLDCCDSCLDRFRYSKDRLIFSLKEDTLSKTDKWTKFLPNNYHQFNHQDGELRAITAINDFNLMFSFDNSTYVTQTDEGILTTTGTRYLGSGSIFERRMKKISSQTNGLGGCIDKFGIVNTPYGVFYPDRLRKTFISYTDRMEEIPNNMKSFFYENLEEPIIGTYDHFSGNIYWTTGNMTISYKPQLKDYVSFHDFIPSNYIPLKNNFISIDKKGLWKHNVPNHYQTYFGKTYPFEVGYVINNKFKQTILQSVDVFAEFYINKGYGSKTYVNEFFKESAVFNDFVSSGIKPLQLKNQNVESDNFIQNNLDGNIEVSRVEFNNYRLNGYQNYAKSEQGSLNLPLIEWNKDKYNLLNINDTYVDSTNGTMRGKWFKLHLISDTTSNTKKLIELALTLNSPVKQ